jgi:glycerol-3-phosphate acyltransferase PlsY
MLAAMPWTATLVTVIAGYLLGSIPVSDLVAGRRRSIDLRTVGDRNPGYWNAKEALGRRAALPIFLGDAAKGAASAGIGRLLADGDWWVAYLGAGTAMIGHAWPVFARFRGGRSVLTFAGAVCVLSPVTAAIAIALLAIVTAASRSFAWGARVGVFVYPLVQVLVDGPEETAATGALMCLIGLRFAMAASAEKRRTDAPATSATGG